MGDMSGEDVLNAEEGGGGEEGWIRSAMVREKVGEEDDNIFCWLFEGREICEEGTFRKSNSLNSYWRIYNPSSHVLNELQV